jgi:hypothetical protein
MAIKPIPDGYTTVTPWLISRDTARLIAYLTEEVSPQDMERRLSDPPSPKRCATSRAPISSARKPLPRTMGPECCRHRKAGVQVTDRD